MAEAPAPHAESGNLPSVCSDQKAGQSKRPTCILVLGMAGSGKTTFVQVLQTSNDRSKSFIPRYLSKANCTEKTVVTLLGYNLRTLFVW